jgi:hypothetical protein
MSDRCPCGARIMGVDTIKATIRRVPKECKPKEYELQVYTCGVCGTQLEIIEN